MLTSAQVESFRRDGQLIVPDLLALMVLLMQEFLI